MQHKKEYKHSITISFAALGHRRDIMQGYHIMLAVMVLFVAVLAPGMAGAYIPHVNVTEPISYPAVYSNQSIPVGKVGPGQTFYVTISSTAINASGVPIERGWNELVASGVPEGWIVQNSSRYSQYLSVMIKPSAYAVNGTYSFYLTAINLGNYSKLGTATFKVYVNVTPDVFVMNTIPSRLSTGPGVPANIRVTINNTGVSDNPFNISVTGLPSWNKTDTVFALHGTSRMFDYPVYNQVPGIYKLRVKVTSTTSALVSSQNNVTMVVNESVPNDYAAIGQGTLAFPIVDEPVYAVMYLIYSVLSYR
jgi:hypothetical protein